MDIDESNTLSLSEEIPTPDVTPPPSKRLCLRDRRAFKCHEVSQLDTPVSTVFSDKDSEYFLTPRDISQCQEASQNTLCFLNFKQLDAFIQQINIHRGCNTPGCRGKLVAVLVKINGYGGAARITYVCDGCEDYEIVFETTQMDGRSSEISRALHVAFIISGCTYATYVKVLRHSLGIMTNDNHRFQETLELMYPVVKEMVEEMCQEAMNEMKEMDQKDLGSWNRAVTTADGAWLTRGHFSKNFTFSVRNYFSGALLFRKHLSMRGSDKIIKEPLYQGTSKGAEGYAAKKVFEEAKSLGMNVEINWQDQDSSSSKAIKTVYPEAQIMVCGGHAGRSHLKQLQNYAKKKKFNKTMKKRLEKDFPEVNDPQSNKCHCEENHSPACGCLSEAFIQQSRNNFSLILSNSETATEFAQRLRNLYHHAIDEHQWEGGECKFHSKIVCSCGECEDRNAPKCPGKEYHTRQILTCPFHKLAYKVEIEHRASMADAIVHPELKRGHSNWMEASHNVLIRFRGKELNLERLHYNVSSDLGLLQANLTYKHSKKGGENEKYHWIPDLYKRMKLPVFSGIEESLKKYNEKRGKKLEKIKEEKAKRKRIQKKQERTEEQEIRKKWSGSHGRDTYGTNDKYPKLENNRSCKCGSTTHSRTSSKDCPLNKRNVNKKSDSSSKNSGGEEQRSKGTKQQLCKRGPKADSKTSSKRCQLNREENKTFESSDNSNSSSEDDDRHCDDYDSELMLDIDTFDEQLLCDEDEQCTCGSTKAHRITCPLNTRKKYGKQLFKPFKLGDQIAIHLQRMKGKHIECRIVQMNDGLYTLFCKRGTLSERFPMSQVQHCRHKDAIRLDKWRLSNTLSVKELEEKDAVNCCCLLPEVIQPEFVNVSSGEDDDMEQETIHNHLYNLSYNDMTTVLPGKWLNDSVINASQKLLLQKFPHVEGLQPPTLQQVHGFQVHRGPFLQIVLVNNNHWSVVSNLGTEKGKVNVYDTLHTKVQPSIVPIVAGLTFISLPALTISMVDVSRQENSWDCGVLAVAIAYELCDGNDPSTVAFDHLLIRKHLELCLRNTSLSQFPSLGRRESQGITDYLEVSLFCTCRQPESDEQRMAECDHCKEWYHEHCVNIPPVVFAKEDVLWNCPNCCKSNDAST